MKQLDDIYILIEKINYQDIFLFMKEYVFDMQPTQDIFEYPQYYGEVELSTNNIYSMIDYVLKEKNRYYRFYFRSPNIDARFKFGMIFINKDGSLILGLSTEEVNTNNTIKELRENFTPIFISVLNELPPPDNIEDFKKISL